MKQLFISDLHLKNLNDNITQKFTAFLQQIAPDADQLYILGDFFEYWIGDDISTELSETVAALLTQLRDQHQVEIYFMHGNRDFLLGEDYCRKAGMTLLPDPSPLPGNPNILLTHGDAQCTSDTGYQQVRQMLRDPAWQQAFLSKSPDERIDFARNARAESQQHQTGYPLTDLDDDAMLADLKQHNATFLLHGHTHQPGIRTIAEGPCKRLVLSDWDHEVYYAQSLNYQQPELLKFNDPA